MIIIHYDFSDGTEISYAQGKFKENNFTTNVLDFFCFKYLKEDVKIIKDNGDYIVLSELLDDKKGEYTKKEIRKIHNVHKMLVAELFTWKKLYIKETMDSDSQI